MPSKAHIKQHIQAFNGTENNQQTQQTEHFRECTWEYAALEHKYM